MKILLFEWLTGGGQWIDCPTTEQNELQEQGQLMLKALENDFSSIGITPIIPLDTRLTYPAGSKTHTLRMDGTQRLSQQLCQLAESVDWIILIAPETGGRLTRCCSWLKDFQEKLLSPNETVIRRFSDKSATCRFLEQNKIPTMDGILLETGIPISEAIHLGAALKLPAVLKPNDGAGGEQTTWIPDLQTLSKQLKKSLSGSTQNASNPRAMRLERWIPGIPASISLIIGERGSRLLPATRQEMAGEPIGTYQRNVDDLSQALQDRALRLGKKVAAAIPQARGYLGIDLILGNEVTDDRVLEINPRLTTSYPLLRTITSENLAQCMLDLVMAEPRPQVKTDCDHN